MSILFGLFLIGGTICCRCVNFFYRAVPQVEAVEAVYLPADAEDSDVGLEAATTVIGEIEHNDFEG